MIVLGSDQYQRFVTHHGKEGVGIDEANEIVSEAIEKGELYSPADAPDNHHTINDPTTDDGPDIDKDTSPDNDDDDDEGGDSQQDNSSSDPGDGPSGQAQSQNGDEEVITAGSNVDNGSNPDTQTAATEANTTTTADTQTAHTSQEQTTPKDCEEGGETTSASSDTQSASVDAPENESEQDSTVTQSQSAQNGSDSDRGQSNTEPSGQAESTQTTETAVGATSQDESEEAENSKPNAQPTEDEIKASIDEKGTTRLQAKANLNPPPEQRVKAAMGAVIEFCHQQIDTEIPENKEWNRNNPSASYRKPETAREYFQAPEYDSGSTPTAQLKLKDDGTPTSVDDIYMPEASAAGIDKIIETAEVNTDFSEDDSASDEDNTDQTQPIVPYNYETRDSRGWSPETIETKKLGWAPRDSQSLREHLLDEGFTKKEIVATGLFNTTSDETLLPRIQCRYVFPYFNSDGEPVFLISRSVNTDIPQGDGPDYFSRAKYLKPKESQLPEPIYGTETIEEGVPLVITEGIADAITAHEYGIPCISPVTTQFKDKHYNVLYNLIIENDIPEVYIIQDADPPNNSVAEHFTQSYHEEYDTTGESHQREPEKADNLWDALTVEQYGPGFEGAVKTARYLRKKAESRAERKDGVGHTNDGNSERNESEANSDGEISTTLKESHVDADEYNYPELLGNETTDVAFETYIITLPRFGEIKYDLDDYLSDGMAQITPPAKWVDNLLDFDTPNAWIGKLEYDENLQFVDPRDYTGDHSIGEVVSSEPLADATNGRV